ncbi:hypothetical protein C1A50_1659 [Paenibacillus polymyxa]|nr:hypothetical protein C1A50_1659 [Paenibacillus polymyxa]
MAKKEIMYPMVFVLHYNYVIIRRMYFAICVIGRMNIL